MDKKATFGGRITNREAIAESDGLLINMEFILCDSEPNDNKQGIPTEAFASLVGSGRFMPVKMEEGRIGGHPLSKPIGTIKDLTTDTEGAAVLGTAALWSKERPEDVALLKQAFASSGLNVSFEVLYTDFAVDDSGVEWLLDPVLRAATIVSTPAYSGRTPVMSLAENILVDLPDSSFAFIAPGGQEKNGVTHPRTLRHFPYKNADGEVDETLLNESLAALEDADFLQKDEVRAVLLEAQAALDEEKENQMDEAKLKELEAESATLRDDLAKANEAIEALTAERDELQSWKAEREKHDAEAALLEKRLAALAEAGFTYEADAVESKRVFWLSLSDEAFATYVSEIKAVQEAKASREDGNGVPDLSGEAGKGNALETLMDHFGKEE